MIPDAIGEHKLAVVLVVGLVLIGSAVYLRSTTLAPQLKVVPYSGGTQYTNYGSGPYGNGTQPQTGGGNICIYGNSALRC